MGLRFSANRLDLGELLEDIGVAENINVRAESFEVLINTQGRKLSDLIVQREISVRLQKGQWMLKDANTGATVTIGIRSAEYTDRPGEPFQLNLRGHIRDIPLSVRWEAQKKHPEDAPDAGYAYRFEAEVAATRLVLTGHMVFPLKRRGVAHRFFRERGPAGPPGTAVERFTATLRTLRGVRCVSNSAGGVFPFGCHLFPLVTAASSGSLMSSLQAPDPR